MRDSRPRKVQCVRQGGVFESHFEKRQTLAPEIRAARMLFSPSAQEGIAQLAEDLESTLQGNQPTRAAQPQKGRRGIALWVAVALGGVIALALAGSSGWVSALKYHTISEKSILIANQEKQLATG